MVMGTHTTFVVRRPTARSSISSVNIYFNLAFLDRFLKVLAILLLSSYSSSGAAAAAEGGGDSSLKALLEFKSFLKNAEDALSSWDPSSKGNPCSSNVYWKGVLCYSGNVWGLQLERMGLGGSINIDSLLPLPQLRTLSFKHNKFEGPLPEFRKLGALKSLFLSDNRFSGDIPDDAFLGMSYLKKVHMTDNNFSGYIPTSLAKSPRLLDLRLENNQFFGPIPNFLPVIRSLNVSNNQLEGPIPTLLSSMDASSFSGNKKLCGKPLKSACGTALSPTEAGGPPGDQKIKNEDEPSNKIHTAVMVIAGLVGVAAMVVIFLACIRQTRKTDRDGENFTPMSTGSQRGNIGDSMSVVGGNNSTKDNHGRLTFINEDRQRFELQDLLRASAEVLGSGSFGSSYKAVLMDPEGQSVVVKRFKQMNKIGREDFQEHMRRLGRLSHPNLLPVVAYYYRKEEKLLVFDYVINSSLATHLHSSHNPGLDWPTRLKIIKGVAKGLAYLYTELPTLNVPHGHLKSSNVLLGKSFEPYLMDYALVPIVNPIQAQQLMVAYKSPEFCHNGIVTKKTDVWSLGILILETLTGKFPSNYLPVTPNYSANTTPSPGPNSGVNLSKSSSSSSWVKSIINNTSMSDQLQVDQTLDKELKSSMDDSRGEMVKLLRIGMACCEDDLEHRLELKVAVEKIEQINERDG